MLAKGENALLNHTQFLKSKNYKVLPQQLLANWLIYFLLTLLDP